MCRLAQTLGITETAMTSLRAALEIIASGKLELTAPDPSHASYESFQEIAEAALNAKADQLIYEAIPERSKSRNNYGHVLRVLVPGGLTPKGRKFLAQLIGGAQHSEVSQTVNDIRVFICYRRDDTGDVAGRLFDKLQGVLGVASCFKDVNSIPLGEDFRIHLNRELESCTVVLVAIGRSWLSATNAQSLPRLSDPNDVVRTEIEIAMSRNIPVVPVLFNKAMLPSKDELPPSIRDLAFRQAVEIRPDPHFHSDAQLLINNIIKSGAR